MRRLALPESRQNLETANVTSSAFAAYSSLFASNLVDSLERGECMHYNGGYGTPNVYSIRCWELQNHSIVGRSLNANSSLKSMIRLCQSIRIARRNPVHELSSSRYFKRSRATNACRKKSLQKIIPKTLSSKRHGKNKEEGRNMLCLIIIEYYPFS